MGFGVYLAFGRVRKTSTYFIFMWNQHSSMSGDNVVVYISVTTIRPIQTSTYFICTYVCGVRETSTYFICMWGEGDINILHMYVESTLVYAR